MIRKNPSGVLPKVHKSVYIDPSAIIIGHVIIEKDVFIGPGAIIRADELKSSIVIKQGCNVQDRVIIHALSGSKVIVGKNTALSHGCIVHGPCEIGKHCFIGFGSVVFDAKVGNNVLVKNLCVIEKSKVPSGKFVPNKSSIGAEYKTSTLLHITKEGNAFANRVLKTNHWLLKHYKQC